MLMRRLSFTTLSLAESPSNRNGLMPVQHWGLGFIETVRVRVKDAHYGRENLTSKFTGVFPILRLIRTTLGSSKGHWKPRKRPIKVIFLNSLHRESLFTGREIIVQTSSSSSSHYV